MLAYLPPGERYPSDDYDIPSHARAVCRVCIDSTARLHRYNRYIASVRRNRVCIGAKIRRVCNLFQVLGSTKLEPLVYTKNDT